MLLLSFFVLAACGKGKSGAVFNVQAATPLSPPSSKPLLAATGDTGALPNRFLTPSAFTVAFTSFKFLQTADPLNPTLATQSYTILDTAVNNPKVVEIKTQAPIDVADSSSTPAAGNYDRVEFEVSYFEMIIPLCDALNRCEDRRLRYYLAPMVDASLNNFSAAPFDLLFSQSPNGFDFGWVSSAQGLPTLIPITNPKPTDPVQIPSGGILPLSPTFSVQLSAPLVVPKNPTDKYIFTLSMDLADLFFFDNTDETTIDKTAPFHFNALVTDITQSADGKARRNCVPPTTACAAEVNFWPGVPVFSVVLTQQAT